VPIYYWPVTQGPQLPNVTFMSSGMPANPIAYGVPRQRAIWSVRSAVDPAAVSTL
jgi:hypothetical protein